MKAYYEANKERLSNLHRSYAAQNAGKRRVVASEWAKENRERRAAIWAAYYTSKMSAMPPWADRDAIKAVYSEARRLTLETGVQYHVDHIIPLQGKNVCGLHVSWNLQPITALANAKKRNRVIEDHIV